MIVSWPRRACGADPRRRLQHVRDHVAMSEHRALRDAGRAAGVLQERDVVVSQRHRRRSGRNCPCCEHVVEAQCARQLPARHLLAHVAHDQVDDRGLRPAELVADAGDDDVLDRGAVDDLARACARSSPG